MSTKELHRLAKKKMKKRIWDWYREPGYRYYHCIRTAKLAVEIIENTDELAYLQNDISIIISAALVHDIKKIHRNHALRAGKYLSKYLNRKELFEPEQRIEIVKMVLNHDKKNNCDFDDYTHIIQDADILSRYGTVQIYSDFYKSGLKRRTRVKTLEVFEALNRNKVEKDLSALKFEYSKRRLSEEISFVNDFYNRMKVDLNGELNSSKDII